MVPRVISVGRRMGLDREELDDVVLAAGLQDIGMLTISESDLEGSGPLSPEARELLHAPRSPARRSSRRRRHSGRSRRSSALLRTVRRRRLPGRPRRPRDPAGGADHRPLRGGGGDDLRQPHRRALSNEDAVAELLAVSGTQFDPRVVAVLAEELLAEVVDRSPPAQEVQPSRTSRAVPMPSRTPTAVIAASNCAIRSTELAPHRRRLDPAAASGAVEDQRDREEGEAEAE